MSASSSICCSRCARLRAEGDFAGRAEPDLSALLDLVALGTVADLVPLDYNNRVLVDAGLRRIRAGQACAGVLALIEASKRSAATLCANDLGFALGPRINAAGRMDDMRLGIECLLCDEPRRARELAERLSAMNAERRELQAQMVEQGEANVAQFLARHGSDTLPVGVVLYEPTGTSASSASSRPSSRSACTGRSSPARRPTRTAWSSRPRAVRSPVSICATRWPRSTRAIRAC